MTEFVTTPTEEWLRSELVSCQSRLLISSPYVGQWLLNLQRSLPNTVRRTLLTRTDIRDFASGSSDLDALCSLANEGTEILSSHRLHAKVYVIDERCGLVTSANATFNGMRGNLECGVVVRDVESVRSASCLVLNAFGALETPQRWTVKELESLQEPVRRLHDTLTASLISQDIDARTLTDVNPQNPVGRALREHLPGWTRLAIEGVQKQNTPIFTLDAFVAACSPLVAERFPNNRNVRPKLRQQLQRLRDMGIIKFLGGGTYGRNA